MRNHSPWLHKASECVPLSITQPHHQHSYPMDLSQTSSLEVGVVIVALIVIVVLVCIILPFRKTRWQI